MVAISPEQPVTDVVDPLARRRIEHIGIVPTASMLTNAFLGIVWFWVPVTIVIIGVSSIFSIIGFLVSAVVFVYLMRAVEWVERLRSEAVFGMQIPVPPRPLTGYTGIHGWGHQLWLDFSGARFWKATAQHFLRMIYDLIAVGMATALLGFAFLGPAAATAVQRSDDDAGLGFLSPVSAWVLAILAAVTAMAILVLGPVLDARIDRWLLAASPTAALKHEVKALSRARQGALTSAQTERHRIERDLHDSVQPRLVSLAMTIGLAQTKLDSDLPAARTLIAEAHTEAMSALAELRNVVRGIAPTILSDRGLDAALSAVVQRTEIAGVPTTLDINLPHRLPAEVEACAYFVVAEALTNVAKHADAGQAVVTVRLDPISNALYVTVFDDGRGGAQVGVDEDATGLRGLAERVRAARGTFEVSSPATGPTIVTAVLPCAS
ncbi:histidine kinase [Mycolicibacterium sp. 22603]|uniref:sensor histidine kinase n=1 Tax=Mycolicibacterium sp. 22603 TaxID=3453950 RepID=UPI003F841A2C